MTVTRKVRLRILLFTLERQAVSDNRSVPSNGQQSDGAASGEAEFTQTIPSRDRARRSQDLEQREQNTSLLG